MDKAPNPGILLQIKELLLEIAANDVCRDRVAPKNERAKELGELIASAIGATHGSLAGETQTGNAGVFDSVTIAAQPTVFADCAFTVVMAWQMRMEEARPIKIEVAFHNTRCPGNEWGDHCLLAIRTLPKVAKKAD